MKETQRRIFSGNQNRDISFEGIDYVVTEAQNLLFCQSAHAQACPYFFCETAGDLVYTLKEQHAWLKTPRQGHPALPGRCLI